MKKSLTDWLLAGVSSGALAVLAMSSYSMVKADEVAFDGFEELAETLKPFDINYGGVDGTDWSKEFPEEWELDNSGNLYDNTDMPGEFDGWSMMDVDSWRGHAGEQAGRSRARFGIDRNVALVCDPDEADDNVDIDDDQMNTYLTRTYDLTGADLGSLELSMDYDIVSYPSMQNIIEVSFDSGATWQQLVEVIGNDVDPSSVYTTNPPEGEVAAQSTFASGVDFTPAAEATEMLLRLGVLTAGNDWWMAVDNIGLADAGGMIAFDDFEAYGEELFEFDAINGGAPSPSDGTDYTNEVSGWEIVNDGPEDMPTKMMYSTSAEGAYQGWTAMDAQSWADQAGYERTFFLSDFFPERNTILVADPDQQDDSDDDPGAPEGEYEYNSFIQKVYDLSYFQNQTLSITMDWEFARFGAQRGLIQASFDGGQSWVTLLDADSDDDAKMDALSDYFFGGEIYSTFAAPVTYQFGDIDSEFPAFNSNSMILRIGCIDGGNDWWFAVDEIRVEADPQGFVFGDANGDGLANFGDITGGTNALITGAYSPEMDFNEDGVVNFGDLAGFTNAIIGN